MIRRAFIALSVVLMVTSIASAREYKGVDMPETLKMNGATVALNGVGLRAVLFIKPYVGGLYLLAPETDGNAIMSADEPMAIRLHMIDDVGQKMMVRSLYNGMRNSVKSTGDDFDPLKERVEKLKTFFNDEIKKGDIFEFEYLPSTGLKVVKNDEPRGLIEGQDFKKAFFGIWLNSDSPADGDLREAMLAGDMQVEVAQIPEPAPEKPAARAAAAEKTPAEMTLAKADTPEEAAAAADVSASDVAEQKQEQVEAAAVEVEKAAEPARNTMENAASEQQAKAEPMKAAAKQEEAKAEKTAEVKADEKAPAAAPAPKKTAKVAKKPAAASTVSAEQVENQAIYFGFDDASLNNSAMKKLDRKIDWMKANPDAKVLVEVYADPRGSNEYNLWLSEKRANSVKKYMTGAGIEGARIETKVYGEEDFKPSQNNPADWAKNRRAQFRVIQ